MSDSKRACHEVIKPLKRALKGQPEHRVATLALMISSLVRGLKAQPFKISAKFPSEAKNTSTVARISRWLKSKHVDSEAFYTPLRLAFSPF